VSLGELSILGGLRVAFGLGNRRGKWQIDVCSTPLVLNIGRLQLTTSTELVAVLSSGQLPRPSGVRQSIYQLCSPLFRFVSG
jgi:hypothetical protein